MVNDFFMKKVCFFSIPNPLLAIRFKKKKEKGKPTLLNQKCKLQVQPLLHVRKVWKLIPE